MNFALAWRKCSCLNLPLCLRAPVTEVERLAAFLDAPRPTLSDTVNTKTRTNKASVLTLLAWSGRGDAPATPARHEAKKKSRTPPSTRADGTESAAAAAAAAGPEAAKRQELRDIKTLLSRLWGADAAPGPVARASFAPAPALAKANETSCINHQRALCAPNNSASYNIAADSQSQQHVLSSEGRAAAAAAAAAAEKANKMERRSPLTGLLAVVKRLGGSCSCKTAYGALPCHTTLRACLSHFLRSS